MKLKKRGTRGGEHRPSSPQHWFHGSLQRVADSAGACLTTRLAGVSNSFADRRATGPLALRSHVNVSRLSPVESSTYPTSFSVKLVCMRDSSRQFGEKKSHYSGRSVLARRLRREHHQL